MSTSPEKRKFTRSMVFPGILVLLCWLVFILEAGLGTDFSSYGIEPLHVSGLKGIFFHVFIHGDINHLINNSIPLFALGTGLFYFYPRLAFPVMLLGWAGTGFLVWLVGRDSYHVGASSLLYVLAFFMFSSGIIRKNIKLSILSLIVVFLYGGMVWGVFPQKGNISWESHLSGALIGISLALIFRNSKIDASPEPHVDEEPSEEDEKDDDGEWKKYQPPDVTYFFKEKEQ